MIARSGCGPPPASWSVPAPQRGPATAPRCPPAKTSRRAGGGYPTSTSDRQRRDLEPPPLGRGPQRQVGQLHPLGPLDQVPGEGPALGRACEEQLHLLLDPVVERLVV